ncbi:MAG: IS110 family transposase [Clostridiales bacterium]|nr:IS110 family transposase [Clostridiales bacterium]
MFFVGIDIAKRSHQVAVTNDSADIVIKPFNIKNSSLGFSSLIEKLTSQSISMDNCVVGMESTGHYWYPLYFFLIEKGFTVKVFNPIQTAAFRDVAIRKVKNDNLDSVMISDFIRFGRFAETIIPNESLLALKNLSRYRFSVTDICTSLKKRTIALLDQVFPEYETIFSDIFGITSRKLLEKFSTPEEFMDVSTTKLTNFIAKISRGRNGREKAELIKSAAHSSIGISYATDSFSFQIKQLIEQIGFIEKQIEDIDKEMEKILAESEYSVITTISGIGPVLGCIIVSEIGDISRFESPSKLVAYAGLDASVKQSGEFNASQNKISKRGSSYLRRALWLAAFMSLQSDPALYNYYCRLKARGKSHRLCVTAVARKLCIIVWAILNSKQPYSPNI